MFMVETQMSYHGSDFRGIFSSLDLAIDHAKQLIASAEEQMLWADSVYIYECEIDNPIPIDRYAPDRPVRRVWWRFIDGTGGDD